MRFSEVPTLITKYRKGLGCLVHVRIDNHHELFQPLATASTSIAHSGNCLPEYPSCFLSRIMAAMFSAIFRALATNNSHGYYRGI